MSRTKNCRRRERKVDSGTGIFVTGLRDLGTVATKFHVAIRLRSANPRIHSYD